MPKAQSCFVSKINTNQLFGNKAVKSEIYVEMFALIDLNFVLLSVLFEFQLVQSKNDAINLNQKLKLFCQNHVQRNLVRILQTLYLLLPLIIILLATFEVPTPLPYQHH